MRIGSIGLGVVLASLWCVSPTFAQLTYRPGQEYRSLNTDFYQIAIQKRGRLDVALSSGDVVFQDVYPMVRFADEEKPERLKIEGRWSQRYAVDDALGVGQGMLIRYKNCEWSIRAYPSKPFLAVQVAYLNTTKKPVTVAEIMPWCVGGTRKSTFSLGRGTDNAAVLRNPLGGELALVRAPTRSETGVAMLNPVTGRTLIAGFLTRDVGKGYVVFEDEKKDEPDSMTTVRFSTRFDKPVVVEPEGRVDSEVLYIALGETDPLLGLERFVAASAVANGIRAEDEDRERDAEPMFFWDDDALANAARHFFVGRTFDLPTLGAGVLPVGGTVRTQGVDTRNVQRTVTALALLGRRVRIEDDGATSREIAEVLERVDPVATRAARPVDLFYNERPRIWHMPVGGRAGRWNIVGIFNWSESDDTIQVPFGPLGLEAGKFYTAYDFWGEQYYGVARDGLNVSVPAGGLRLLGMRRYRNRPMVLALDSHFMQGAVELAEISWDARKRVLSGSFDALGDRAYTLRVLVPEPYVVTNKSSTAEESVSDLRERVLSLRMRASEAGPILWKVEFAGEI